MSATKPPTNYEFDDEPDGIEESGNGLSSTSNNGRRIDEVNSLDKSNNFQRSNDSQISRNDELEFAGYDEEADELLASEYRIKQENEQAEIRPVSEKPSVRMFSVLTGTGVVLGIFGFLWFTFFAPKPVRQQAKTSTPEVTPSPPNDESAELKSRLAFQDQQRTLESYQPPTPKERPTPTPTPTATPTPAPAPKLAPKPTPKAVPVARTLEPPRRVQNFNPPPRVVQTISPPPRPIPSPPPPPPPPPPPRPIPSPPPPPPPPRPIPSPPPPPPPPPRPLPSPPPTEKVDPYKRWAQLASLGQSRGEVADNPSTESPVASNPIASRGTTITTQSAIPTPSPSTLTIAPAETSPGTPITPVGTPPTPPPDTPTTTPVATSTPSPQDWQPTPLGHQNTQPTQISPQNTHPSATPAIQPGIASVAIEDTRLANSNSSTNPSPMSEGEAGILNRTTVNQSNDDGITTKEIAIGSSAKAKVIVPMIWDEAGQSPTGGRFAVQLTEDMKATDGVIALPSGTVLITEVNNVTRSNRLVSQSVVALVYPDSSGRIHQTDTSRKFANSRRR